MSPDAVRTTLRQLRPGVAVPENPARMKYDLKREEVRRDSRHVACSMAGMTGRGLVQALRNLVLGEDPLRPTDPAELRRLVEAGLLLWSQAPGRHLPVLNLTELGLHWCEQLGIGDGKQETKEAA